MRPSIAAVLLAAGSSRRIGRPKQLLLLRGKPFLRCCAETILESGIDDFVVVLGRDFSESLRVIRDLPASVVFNPHPASEMADSIRIALRTISGLTTAVLVCLVDHPLVSAETLQKLVDAHAEDQKRIVIPRYRDKKGHPVLVPFDLVREIHFGFTLRDIIENHADRVRTIDVDDEGVVLDVDTPGDYARMLARLGRKPHEYRATA